MKEQTLLHRRNEYAIVAIIKIMTSTIIKINNNEVAGFQMHRQIV